MDIESSGFPPIISESEAPEEVLSRFAHELKHPINSIKGWADLILRGATDYQGAAERIHDIAENMGLLRNAVIDYLRARGSLE